MTRKSYLFKVIFLISSIILANCNINDSVEQGTQKNQSLNSFEKIADVEWGKPKGFSLTMDIYVPKTEKSSLPVLVIFHGGGWLINNKSIMNQMSEYIVQHSEYIVCNVNYRLLGDNGNTTMMNEIVEDVLGAVLWVKVNIGKYNGDPTKIAVTGDSAGGHLAAMIVNSGNRLESKGFDGPTLGFNPTYLPRGKSAEDIIKEGGLEVQAAILSYGAFDMYAACLGGLEKAGNYFWAFSGNIPRGIFGNEFSVQKNPDMYKAVSPIYNIPNISERKLPPQLAIVGTLDKLITPASVQNYVSKIKESGQSIEYWEHEGRPHAFLDSGKNDYLGINFEDDAPPALNRMIQFLDSVFN